MLRFDYHEQENGLFEVTVISEIENVHALAGKLVLRAEEFFLLKEATQQLDNYYIAERASFFKFENKGIQTGEKR